MGSAAQAMIDKLQAIFESSDTPEQKIVAACIEWDADIPLNAAPLEEILKEFDRRGLFYHITFSSKAVVNEK